MEELALERETDEASKDRLERLRGEPPTRRRSCVAWRPVGRARRLHSRAPASCASRSTSCGCEAERLQRAGDLAAGLRDPLRTHPRAGEADGARGVGGGDRGPDGPRGGRPRGDRRGGGGLDRASRPAGCSRARPRSCCGWRTSSAGGWSVSGAAVERRLRRRTTLAGRDVRPQPADRGAAVLRADRRRQDRARQALADYLFDGERATVRLDMSEYSERHRSPG